MPFIYKVLFNCIVLLFPLEIIEDISAGHFTVELVEIRAYVLERGSLSVLYNYCYERVANNCQFDTAQMHTQTHTHTPVYLRADCLMYLHSFAVEP